jgi:AcrR family transcriptional regulator
VQVKKPAVREAILKSAFLLFSERGYVAATLAEIASGAGVTTSNIYRYYGSKLEILYAVFGPWFDAHVARLERRLRRTRSPKLRLRTILHALWYEIPRADNGFNNNLIQALAMATPGQGYSRALLLTHALFMAADGFAMNVKLNGSEPPTKRIVDLVCDLLLGVPAMEAPPHWRSSLVANSAATHGGGPHKASVW